MFIQSFVVLSAAGLIAGSASGAAILYNNLTPTNSMAVATRQGAVGITEIETADDFVLGQSAKVTSASFTGLMVPNQAGGSFTVTDISVEIYRVFPLDSNTVRTPNVPTRANSPSDIELVDRDSGAGQLSFSSTTLSNSFTALNSIQAGGIHPLPGQTTGGNGPITGQEVQFDVTFNIPFLLLADHYFFVPQVTLSNGAQFYWLSASRPISGAGTTPISPDLQVWTRDANLDPDWLRVGTDIVGGGTPPTFNTAFSLSGDVVPEPSSLGLVMVGLAAIGFGYRRRMV